MDWALVCQQAKARFGNSELIWHIAFVHYNRDIVILVNVYVVKKPFMTKKTILFVIVINLPKPDRYYRIRMYLNLKIPGVNFINILRAAFTREEPESAKKTVKLSIFFCAFGICAHKSCSLNVGEIDAKRANFNYFYATL